MRRMGLVLLLMLCLGLISTGFSQSARPTTKLCQTGCTLPPTGMLGWWPADGNANDIQLGNNGVVMNGATFSPGLVKQAFLLDGIDDFVDVPDSPALHAVTTAFTVGAWINPQVPTPPSGAGYSEGWIFARRDPLVSEGFSLWINSDGGDGFLAADLSANASSGVASAVPVIHYDGTWKHVALTADTTTGKVTLYLNGEQIELQNSPIVSGQFPDVTHLFIGQRQSADTPEGPQLSMHYKGLIDEVEVYNRALTPAEIHSIYFVGARGKCKP